MMHFLECIHIIKWPMTIYPEQQYFMLQMSSCYLLVYGVVFVLFTVPVNHKTVKFI